MKNTSMMKIINKLSVVFVVTVSLMVGASFANELPAKVTVENGYVRGLPPGQTVTAAFMRLLNHSDEAMTLVAGSSNRSKNIEIHTTRHHEGMMHMEKVASVVIPAGGEFEFVSGKYHLMLVDLIRPLSDGEMVDISLSFSNGSELAVRLPVRSVLTEHMDKH
jgi:copper(I)-binding protein